PGLEPPGADSPHVNRIALGRLDRREAMELVQFVPDSPPLSDEVAASVVDRADGIPLFLEEFAKWHLEASRASGSMSLSSAIPSTLQESLGSQLDRLGMAKPVAQLAAIIGRIFPYWLLSRLWPFDEKSLRSGLAQIIEAGLLAPQPHGPEGEDYVFKHELIRDAAYESLLKSKRQSLHLQIANIIRSEREKYSDMRPELIAYHYTAAGLAAEAGPLWLEAGQLALRESAIREAR